MLVKTTKIYALFILILLSACSENVPKTGDSDADSSNDSLINTHFLPFEIRNFLPGGNTYTSVLQVMDSQKPGPEGVQAVNGTGTAIEILSARFNQGSFNAVELTKSNYRLDSLLYTQDNSIYKLDLFDVKKPEPIRLSHEFQANDICHGKDIWEEDFANFSNSRYVYYIATDCQSNNGEWHMINLSMDESQAPVNLLVDINYFVSSVINQDNGAIDGWLIVNSQGYLSYYDVEFTANRFVKLNNQNFQISNNAFFLMRNRQKQIVLSLDDSIVWYNSQSKLIDNKIQVLSSALTSQIYQWRSDGVYLYFTVNNFAADGTTVTSSTLNRVLLENAQQVEELFRSPTGKIDRIEVGYGGVVFSVNRELRVYSASNSSINIIDNPVNHIISTNTLGQAIFFVTDDVLMVEYFQSGDASVHLVKILNTNAQLDESLQDHHIAAIVYNNFLELNKTREIDRVVLESGKLSSETRTLFSFVPAQYPIKVTLGVLPVDNNPRLLDRVFAYGHNEILLQGTFNSSTELFFIDASKANSLLRVTNNQTTERVVNF